MEKRKKRLVMIMIVTVVILLLVIFGIIMIIKNNGQEESKVGGNNGGGVSVPRDSIERINGEAYEIGYMEISEDDKEVILTNYKEFEKYFEKYEQSESWGRIEDIINSYNKKFFNQNKLAVIYEPVSSDDITVRYKKCKIEDDVANITCKIKTPTGEMSQEKSGYFILVELPEEINSITVEKENAPK